MTLKTKEIRKVKKNTKIKWQTFSLRHTIIHTPPLFTSGTFSFTDPQRCIQFTLRKKNKQTKKRKKKNGDEEKAN